MSEKCRYPWIPCEYCEATQVFIENSRQYEDLIYDAEDDELFCRLIYMCAAVYEVNPSRLAKCVKSVRSAEQKEQKADEQ